jgi:hypothetical protein
VPRAQTLTRGACRAAARNVEVADREFAARQGPTLIATERSELPSPALRGRPSAETPVSCGHLRRGRYGRRGRRCNDPEDPPSAASLAAAAATMALGAQHLARSCPHLLARALPATADADRAQAAQQQSPRPPQGCRPPRGLPYREVVWRAACAGARRISSRQDTQALIANSCGATYLRAWP